MAAKLKTEKEWEDYDATRMKEAVREISASPNLRFFFRSLLNSYGMNSTPFGGNAIDTAKLCGRHEAGMDIVSTFLALDPSLYPNLILEDVNEQADRAAS